jgi:hypothetical protein
LNSDFTDTDWIEIYVAVNDKSDGMKTGVFGRDREARDWRKQLEHILAELDEIRAEYIGGGACE